MSSEEGSVIVVGIDGSSDNQDAVRWATSYATATGANLRLVTAWERAQSYGAPMMFDDSNPKADAQTLVDKAAADLTIPPERVQTVVDEGMPGPVFIKASEDAAALVVGNHGHRAVSGLLLGSVSAYSVRHAACPVVVVL